VCLLATLYHVRVLACARTLLGRFQSCVSRTGVRIHVSGIRTLVNRVSVSLSSERGRSAESARATSGEETAEGLGSR